MTITEEKTLTEDEVKRLIESKENLIQYLNNELGFTDADHEMVAEMDDEDEKFAFLMDKMLAAKAMKEGISIEEARKDMLNKMRIRLTIFGASGQVGSAFPGVMTEDSNFNPTMLDRSQADFSDLKSLQDALDKHSPDIIINAAAYTAVDKAEEEPELANTINADAVRLIAQDAAKNNIILIHYSTDYVYPGHGHKPWREVDQTAPASVYARSKLAGEQAIIESGVAQYMIFRTSWVFDSHGKNFMNTMLKLGQEREEISVVNDQFGAPTYAPLIADVTMEALDAAMSKSKFPSGIYNIACSGTTTWYEFAVETFKIARELGMELKVKKVIPIPTSAYPTPAKRPANSRLSLDKLKKTFKLDMPDWRVCLRHAIEHKLGCDGHHHHHKH
jgi:dTDP-4-dehydrorhamnose reductase